MLYALIKKNLSTVLSSNTCLFRERGGGGPRKINNTHLGMLLIGDNESNEWNYLVVFGRIVDIDKKINC